MGRQWRLRFYCLGLFLFIVLLASSVWARWANKWYPERKRDWQERSELRRARMSGRMDGWTGRKSIATYFFVFGSVVRLIVDRGVGGSACFGAGFWLVGEQKRAWLGGKGWADLLINLG